MERLGRILHINRKTRSYRREIALLFRVNEEEKLLSWFNTGIFIDDFSGMVGHIVDYEEKLESGFKMPDGSTFTFVSAEYSALDKHEFDEVEELVSENGGWEKVEARNPDPTITPD